MEEVSVQMMDAYEAERDTEDYQDEGRDTVPELPRGCGDDSRRAARGSSVLSGTTSTSGRTSTTDGEDRESIVSATTLTTPAIDLTQILRVMQEQQRAHQEQQRAHQNSMTRMLDALTRAQVDGQRQEREREDRRLEEVRRWEEERE